MMVDNDDDVIMLADDTLRVFIYLITVRASE